MILLNTPANVLVFPFAVSNHIQIIWRQSIIYIFSFLAEMNPTDNQQGNILQKNNNNYEALSVKCFHLTQQNIRLHHFLQDLETQLCSVNAINHQLLSKSQNSAQIVVQELAKQNGNLEKSLFRLIKNNQELSSDLLMKSQIITQNEYQFREMIKSYENKIFQLRTSLQAKQCFMTTVQLKRHAQKGEPFNAPSKANVMCFDEISDLRNLVEHYHVQNSSLQLLLISKNQQLQQMRLKLEGSQKSLKNGEKWANYISSKEQNSNQADKTKQKPTFKIKLQQQLTRYDSKYKNISNYNSKGGTNFSQLTNLKLIVSKMYCELQNQQQQIKNLRRMVANKQKDLNEIKLSYKELQMEMQQQRVQVDFYRANFKELTKVSTQRKIKYYDQYYQQILPAIQQHFKNYHQTVAYWKQQQNSNSGNPVQQRRKLLNPAQKPTLKRQKKCVSCITKYNVFVQKPRKVCRDLKLQNSITSFINQTHNYASLTNYTLEAKVQISKTQQQQDILFGEISAIERPIKKTEKVFRKERNQVVFKQES